MYEHHKEPLSPREQFLRRATRHGGVFVAAAGLFFSPFLHRVLHRMHVED